MKPVLSLPVIMCLGLVLGWQVTGCGRPETAAPQRDESSSVDDRTASTSRLPDTAIRCPSGDQRNAVITGGCI